MEVSQNDGTSISSQLDQFSIETYGLSWFIPHFKKPPFCGKEAFTYG